jgi:intracellular septation protein
VTLALVGGGVAALALLLAWRWRPRQPMAPGIRTLLLAYALLGTWALAFGLYAPDASEPAGLSLWKPTVMYGVLAGVLLVAPMLGWGYPVKAIVGAYFVFSNREWGWINLGFALLCALLGATNLVIAFAYPRGDWEGFKFSCMVNVLGIVLLRLTFVWVDAAARIVKALHARARALLP